MSQIKKIGVVGAGNMGSGIAQKIAQEGIPVVMVDLNEEFVQRGLDTIRRLLQEGVERKLFKPEQVDQILGRVTGTTDFEAVADADIVIEAVFEDKQVKAELFAKLDQICSPQTILATNTSSFYVREFAEKTSRPDRFVGLHYFYHPAKNRLLEVIPHSGTSVETLEKSMLAAKLHGKTAIRVKDAPGFAVNRFFVPFLNEAARMLAEGLADIPTIEEAGKRAFKIGMGPFELMNVTGIPIAVHASTTLGNELGAFYAPAPILKSQLEKKENWKLEGPVDESKIPAVVDRFHGVCLGVAAALVDEGVASIEDTDRGAKIGLRWVTGPFEIMNMIGIHKTYEVVQAVCRKYPEFKMPAILEKQHALGKPFEFNFVDIEVKNGIAYITLNRPEAMNALNETVVAQLDRRFSQAEADPAVKAIVFQGAGKAFVAGADIRYFVEKIKAGRIPDIVEFTRRGHDLLLRIEESPKLTIALLDGPPSEAAASWPWPARRSSPRRPAPWPSRRRASASIRGWEACCVLPAMSAPSCPNTSRLRGLPSAPQTPWRWASPRGWWSLQTWKPLFAPCSRKAGPRSIESARYPQSLRPSPSCSKAPTFQRCWPVRPRPTLRPSWRARWPRPWDTRLPWP
jgi:enoyl-CoA hydratase/3-hydroxyacyl-CoA dehydrogenase